MYCFYQSWFVYSITGHVQRQINLWKLSSNSAGMQYWFVITEQLSLTTCAAEAVL